MSSGDRGAALPRPLFQSTPPPAPSLLEEDINAMNGGRESEWGAESLSRAGYQWPPPRACSAGAFGVEQMAMGPVGLQLPDAITP